MIYIKLFIIAGIIYSAQRLGLETFSPDWFFYCLAWTPLILLFLAAERYDKSNPSKPSQQRTHRR